MKKNHNREIIWFALLAAFLMSIITPGIASALEEEAITVGPITSAFVIMLTKQTKTFNVESDLYPATLIISLAVYGSGTLNVSVTKNDTSGELIGVMQLGGYNTVKIGQQYGATVGVTPCSLALNARFWDAGFGIIVSGLVSSLEKGPHKYSVSLSYN